MSEIRVQGTRPGCTVTADEVSRLARNVLDAVRAMKAAFSALAKRPPYWIRSEDGAWYVVILTAEQFGEAKAREETAAAERLRARDLASRDDARLAKALSFAEQCQHGSGPWCRHADALLTAVRSHFGLLAVPTAEPEPGPRLGQPDEIEGCE